MGFGIWMSKEVEHALKSPFGLVMQATSEGGDNFDGKGGRRFLLCNNAALKLYSKSY